MDDGSETVGSFCKLCITLNRPEAPEEEVKNEKEKKSLSASDVSSPSSASLKKPNGSEISVEIVS